MHALLNVQKEQKIDEEPEGKSTNYFKVNLCYVFGLIMPAVVSCRKALCLKSLNGTMTWQMEENEDFDNRHFYFDTAFYGLALKQRCGIAHFSSRTSTNVRLSFEYGKEYALYKT